MFLNGIFDSSLEIASVCFTIPSCVLWSRIVQNQAAFSYNSPCSRYDSNQVPLELIYLGHAWKYEYVHMQHACEHVICRYVVCVRNKWNWTVGQWNFTVTISWLTPWIIVVLEGVISHLTSQDIPVAWLVKKFPEFYGIRRFITVFTKALTKTFRSLSMTISA
jgi:hypothetical protein